MLTRDAIRVRLSASSDGETARRLARLPTRLKADKVPARNAILQRLAASRLFAYGDRTGVLRAAQARSGRPFRLDVRQRVIVKALVSRHAGQGFARGAALAAHVSYLARSGAGVEGARADFFDRNSDGVDAGAATAAWGDDRHHFRFIISPEHGDRIADLKRFTRETMRRVADDLGEPELQWIGACHFDTDQPHAHVLVRGRRASGRDLVMPRHYIGYGFRARAQEVAHELLGDLSRVEAEQRIWRETQADRFTGFDRRLLQAADANLEVDDGVGATDVWGALSRGRLRHLETLGLAVRHARRYRLDPALESKLRTLQLRRDVIRTLHQRRLESGRELREMGDAPLKGQVVKAGQHDELGASRWVIVRSADGVEHFARLKLGQTSPAHGQQVELSPTPQGAQVGSLGRGSDLSHVR
jgi:type IV secretory pathway VirD2 relaxase